jgi:hypothetical protein
VHLAEAPRQEINNLIGGAAEVRYLSMTTEFDGDATVQVCDVAGMPGCPTTRSQHGTVKQAAIALWIGVAPARSVLPRRNREGTRGQPGTAIRGAQVWRSIQSNVRPPRPGEA